MLNPRKPGGRRWQASPDRAAGLLERHPHVGALISTSAEALSYEWSELQSGIFSHEVRSGLRGAADANGDGTITYEELAGFVLTANQDLINDGYRPRLFARGPGDALSEPILSLPRAARRLDVGAEHARRLTLRDRLGVRVADLHSEPGSALAVVLPEGEIQVVEHGDHPEIAARGAAPVFERLFARPYGAEALAQLREDGAFEGLQEAHYGVTRHDALRLDDHMNQLAAYHADQRSMSGWLLIGAGSAITGMGIHQIAARDANADFPWPGAAIALAGGTTLGLGTSMLLTTSPQEDLHAEYLRETPSTEAERAEVVLRYERRLFELIREERAQRKTFGILMLINGGIGIIGGGLLAGLSISRDRAIGPNTWLLLGLGVGGTGIGIYQLASRRSIDERVWELYEGEPTVEQRLGAAPSVLPGVGLVEEGATLTLSGSF